MNKTRIAVKWFAGTIAATALVLGSMSAPAQAKDTGWNPVSTPTSGASAMKDTGWNPV